MLEDEIPEDQDRPRQKDRKHDSKVDANSSTSDPIPTFLIDKVPNWFFWLIGWVGAIVGVVATYLLSTGLTDKLIGLDASWLEWAAFPLAAVAGFFAANIVIVALLRMIEWTLGFALLAVVLTAIAVVVWVGFVTIGW